MHHRRGGEDGVVAERVVDPLGLVLKGGVWYIVARAENGLRTYRVSRILDLNIMPDKFERSDDFELADYWERSVAADQESMPSFQAVVRVGPEGLDRLGHAFGGPAARAARAASGEPDESGWLTLRLRVEDLWHAEPQILMLGTEAEVLDPEELRDRIAAASRGMAARYHTGAAERVADRTVQGG